MSLTTPSFVELKAVSTKAKLSKYSAAERQSHCEEWKKSGLSMNEYCRRSGLTVSSLSLWVQKLKTKPAMTGENNVEKMLNVRQKQGMEIILVSGIVLRFAEVSNIAEILKLVKALELCA